VSLRARLLAGLIALTAAGLVAAGIATYAAERSFLVARVDQLFNVNSINGFEDFVDAKLHLRKGPAGSDEPHDLPEQPHGPPGAGIAGTLPVGTYGVYIAPDGTRTPTAFEVTDESQPKLPATIPLTPLAHLQHPRLITVGARGRSNLQFRVMAKRSDTSHGVLVIATPLRDVSQTLTRLRNVEIIVIAAVLVALAAVALLLIRVGLRPLDRIGATAKAIAAGDLSRRVSPDNQRTEVGRLGAALNAMLGQIEGAFREREASEERLRRFLSDASHELRTPLTSIRGYAELFRLGAAASPEETAKAMARIEEEAGRMGVLVEDLLALARLDEMPQTRHEPVDLLPLVRDAAEDARAAAPGRTIALAAAGEHIASGDASQLRQVLANLLRNALTHTPEDSPIEVSLEDAGGFVRVIVRDHGPGLPPGAQENIFERFWRSEGGRERGRAGAGLGLAIVAAIVDAHGGRVSAQNAAGGGAAFAFEIPAPAAEERRLSPSAPR
jgi:two-component system, OmpR family, sensor kinase